MQSKQDASNPELHVSLPDETGKAATRRQFIKAGAAAVPMVFTLQSGAALAMSSVHHCIPRNAELARQKRPPAVLDHGMRDPSGLSWLRHKLRVKEVVRLDMHGQPHGKPFKIYQEKKSGFDLAGRPGTHPDVWHTMKGEKISTLEFKTLRDLEPEHGLVQIDQQGYILRVSPQPGGGTPVTTSCWTSIATIRRTRT